MVGGEAFPRALAAELASLTTGDVYNMYGPTETTIWSATHRVQGTEQNIAIGLPIANTQIYILDGNGNLLPPGAIGELCIGGDGLARGYLNRPELTAEKFVALRARGGARVYRTGDLARYRPNGEIEFMGRLDTQIKIQGYRIEIEEIEAILGQHPGVRAAAISSCGTVPGEMHLVAYFVAREGHTCGPRELRRYLQEKLPPPMLPAFFVPLDTLPYTPNGKIDRKMLAAMGQPAEKRTGSTASISLERVIAETWKEILEVDAIAMSENLF